MLNTLTNLNLCHVLLISFFLILIMFLVVVFLFIFLFLFLSVFLFLTFLEERRMFWIFWIFLIIFHFRKDFFCLSCKVLNVGHGFQKSSLRLMIFTRVLDESCVLAAHMREFPLGLM